MLQVVSSARMSSSPRLAVKPDRTVSDVGGNQKRLSAFVSPQAMAFALLLTLIKIRGFGAMTKSIIPWHVFQNAIETLNPDALDRWLERWRFTDGGVVLCEGILPALDPSLTRRIDD